MLNPKRLRKDFVSIIEALRTRGLPEGIEAYPELDEKRRALLTQAESIRAEKNRLGPDIAKAKREGIDVSELTAKLKASGEKEKALECEMEEVEAALSRLELVLPNLPHESVPIGKSEQDNRVEKEWGEKREFLFEAKAHWDIGEALGILDFETAAKLSGARFALYLGAGAQLERALINFMLDMHGGNGYVEAIPPLLVREQTMVGSGQLPKFRADVFSTAGSGSELFLIPTAEVPLCNIHAGEIMEANALPSYYVAYTPCFRSEAGSHGRDVRGLIRLHQFNKVELVKITSPDTSYEELEKLTADAERILETLELPYRRVTLSSGDMGLAAAKTYDLEVWLPGLGEYREISSCSNTTDFQSRRNKTRFREKAGAKPEFVHMLNGSGLAVGRTVIAVLENYQQEDGSVLVPKVLQPYMSGREYITS